MARGEGNTLFPAPSKNPYRQKGWRSTMKTSKRVLAVFSAACIAASMSIPAFAASVYSSEGESTYNNGVIAPRSVEVAEEIYNSSGHATSSTFTCTRGEGESLRVWYENTSPNDCKVTLVLESKVSDNEYELQSMIVSAGDNQHFTYDGPGAGTYFIKLVSVNGGEVRGYVRANQF